MIRIITADVREGLRQLIDEGVRVQTCVTSPPYFGLRDYGVDGQVGLEETPAAYVEKMVEIFREVRRVLKDDGTLWLNLGDSYAGSWGARGRGEGTNAARPDLEAKHGTAAPNRRGFPALGVKPKDLIGIPWMLAFALRQPFERVQIKDKIDRSWLAALVDGEGCITALECKSPHDSGSSYPPVLQVRMCDIEPIVHCNRITGYGKPSPQQSPPSAGGNRPSYQWRIHGRKAADIMAEIYPYLLIKRKQAVVAYNLQLVRESYEVKRGVKIPEAALAKQIICREMLQKLNARESVDIPSWMVEPKIAVEPGYYLRQDVIWSKPNPMPESVADRCTKAHEYIFLLSKSERYYFDAEAMQEPALGGTPGNVTHKGKTKYEAGDERMRTKAGLTEIGARETRNRRSVWTVATQPFKGAHFAIFPPALIEPCILAGAPEGGTVLDPFGGAGTTGLVAERHKRNAILIELNPLYAEMARKRITNDAPLFAEVQ